LPASASRTLNVKVIYSAQERQHEHTSYPLVRQ